LLAKWATLLSLRAALLASLLGGLLGTLLGTLSGLLSEWAALRRNGGDNCGEKHKLLGTSAGAWDESGAQRKT
jgi:hypothetical protein